MRIYISGPITGIDENRCDVTFGFTAADLEIRGHEPISPWHVAKMLPDSFSYEDYMDIDMVLLKKCDAILMLDGWEESRGATREFGYASRNDLPIFYSINEIPENK